MSCATLNKESAQDLINKKEISKQSVLDISRTSYQKGCIDAFKYKYPPL